MAGPYSLLFMSLIVVLPGISASQTPVNQPIALKGHKDSILALTFLGDGELIASASSDKTIKIWDTGKEKEISTLTGHKAGVGSLACSRNGKLLASGDEKGILRIWDVDTKKELHVLDGQALRIESLAFSHEGSILAAGVSVFDQVAASIRGEIRLWNPSTGKQIAVMDGLETPVVSMAVSPNGKRLASCCSDGSVYLWELEGDH
jgi:WD40 repeat protein